MKKVVLVIILVIVFILIICGIEFFVNKTGEDNTLVSEINTEQVERDIDNVNMTIKEGTLTRVSATIVIEDKNEETYGYGEWFRIDKKEDGEWKELELIDEDYTFTSIAYIPGEDGISEINENWEDLYGELEDGEYRLVKELYGNEISYIYVEFTIE